MSFVAFENLADASRVWIYGCARALSPDEAAVLNKRMAEFLEAWTAHKRELQTGWQLVHGQFIMVGVDERTMTASGCSVDSLVRFLRQLETDLQCLIVGTTSMVFYRSVDGSICCVDRPTFKKSVQEGEVAADTTVFDNTILTVAELRSCNWEKSLKNSWHQRAFPVPG